MKPMPIWIRKVLTGLLTVGVLFLLLAIVGWWLDKGYQDDASNHWADKTIALRKTDWVDEAFQVYTSGKRGPVSVKGKTAKYSTVWLGMRGEKGDTTVTAFVTESGRVWAGPEQKFYIETKSDVVGIDVAMTSIMWSETMVSIRPSEKVDVDRVVQRLEKEILERGIVGTFKYLYGKNATSFKVFEDYQDDYRSSPEGYSLAKSEQPIQVSGNTARLEVMGDFHSTGTLWVNINSRKLQKAVRNGKQVFPKWWWSW